VPEAFSVGLDLGRRDVVGVFSFAVLRESERYRGCLTVVVPVHDVVEVAQEELDHPASRARVDVRGRELALLVEGLGPGSLLLELGEAHGGIFGEFSGLVFGHFLGLAFGEEVPVEVALAVLCLDPRLPGLEAEDLGPIVPWAQLPLLPGDVRVEARVVPEVACGLGPDEDALSGAEVVGVDLVDDFAAAVLGLWSVSVVFFLFAVASASGAAEPEDPVLEVSSVGAHAALLLAVLLVLGLVGAVAVDEEPLPDVERGQEGCREDIGDPGDALEPLADSVLFGEDPERTLDVALDQVEVAVSPVEQI